MTPERLKEIEDREKQSLEFSKVTGYAAQDYYDTLFDLRELLAEVRCLQARCAALADTLASCGLKDVEALQARCCALEEALESSKEYLDLLNEENFNPNEADNLFDKIKEALEIHGPAALEWLEKQKMEARREGAKQND